VEDNTELNQYLLSLLETHYCVETAFDGAEGYRKAIEIKPDIILSDVMMPEMDGFEFCQRIKSNEETATIPFVLLTAKSSEQYKLLGVQTGADEYISKPFDPDYLLEKIRSLLLAKKKYKKQFSKSVRLEPSDVEISSSEEAFIQKTILIIEKNLQNDNFSSDILASELNMSNSSLYRKLKELTGSSTAEFIRSIRIKRAGQLLADKERTVTEIAYEVGFNDVKHFRTVFQKQFGCSPSEYRSKL
jgi:YesN/AraC family two-component response regulator